MLLSSPAQERISYNPNMKSNERWTEIRFATLCFNLYKELKDYILVTEFLELLADIANVDKNKALRLLQKVNQISNLKPTKSEYVCVAKQNGCTIETILKNVHISKTAYIEIMHSIDLNYDYKATCSYSELTDMQKLLEVYDKLKGLTI